MIYWRVNLEMSDLKSWAFCWRLFSLERASIIFVKLTYFELDLGLTKTKKLHQKTISVDQKYKSIYIADIFR